MKCNVCFHPSTTNPHFCLLETCPSCYSPKDIFSMYCVDCMYPCSFCLRPSKYNINVLNLCLEHLSKACQVQKSINDYNRIKTNVEYVQKVSDQKKKKLKARKPAVYYLMHKNKN